MAEHKQPVAEDLSRMEGEYGAKMIGKLKQMHILIIGLRGLGVETAKNLILAGPHTVSVHDERTAVIADMGANFYLDKKEIGKTRAEAIIHQLGNLNPNVNVHIVKQITEQELKKYQVVVVTDHYPQNLLAQWNDICHHHTEPIAFIAAAIDGACAHVFSDFGPHHVVFDDNGVPAKSIVIDHISNAKNGVVEIDGDRHLLNDGDLIKIEEVLGMSEPKHSSAPTSDEDDQKYTPITDIVTDINGVFEIKTTKNPKKFLIGDTTKLGTYISGGLGTQIKKHLVHKYKTFTETLINPPFCQGYMDFSKFGRDAQLHIARLALYRFQSTSHRLPRLHDTNDADTMVKLAKTIVEEHKKVAEQKQEALVVDVEEDIIRKVSYYAETELTALAALFGGVVAQEITKQAGKYTPIDQWLHFDAFELLDDTVPVDGKPVGSRYDHQIAVFGKHFQDTLEKQKVFLVGCGALGCEYIKGIALMGLGIHGGAVHMTDDDRIELSNLSRQFLFRRKHVGHPKSKSAAEAALEMNPELSPVLKAHEIRVEPKTEDVFDDTFWDGLDFVLNALDNQIARKYTDSKCVLHSKPLFESGTLGTQANSVICLPHKTPSYSEGAVAGEEQGIAKCTLRNFPSDVIHCIEWAREKFDDLFVSGADLANSLLEDRTGFFQKLKQDPLSEADSLKAAKNWLDLSASPSFETCVKLLFDEFLTNFRNGINDLTHNFPKDARNIDKETKADLGPFWHGHKRFPQSAEFTAQDELHVDYIFHGANIMASVFGLPEKSRDEVRAMVAKLRADPWVYTGAAVDLSEGDKKEAPAEVKVDEEDAQAIQRLTQYLSSLDLSKYRPLAPADFEKDNDANHHIDFITAATNLRAWNYFIKPATRQKARMVAGRIIPAIATTTACITGFIEIEIYKYVKSVPLEKHRAATINLATNTFVCENLPDPLYRKSGMDPQTYMPVVAIPEKFTCWDLITIDAPGITMEQFFEEFKRVHHGCVIDMLATPSGQVLYNSVDLYGDQKSKVEARLKRPLMDVYTEIAGKIFPPSRHYVLFESTVEDESGDAGIVPMIKYIFKH